MREPATIPATRTYPPAGCSWCGLGPLKHAGDVTLLVHIAVTVAATPAELELRRLLVLGADHDFLQDREHFVEG
jgi:hypothetical protein